jgi:hypothetical protein
MDPEKISERTRWKIVTGKDNFLSLKNDEGFWTILALGRAVNALFFSHQALVAHEGDDSPAAVRARFNSVLFSCSILVESSPLVQALGKHFSHLPEFKKLSNLVNGKEARKIRQAALARLRNKLVFHFDPTEIGRQLSRLDFPEATFLSAMGKTNAQTYYEMSDLCALGTLYGASYPSSDALMAAATEVTEAVSKLIVDFSNVAQEFIVAVLEVQGWYGEISEEVK